MLDPIDLKILSHLRERGRLSNLELAELVSVSEATIRRRINYLTEKGFIKGFSAVLDYKKFTSLIRMNLYALIDPSGIEEFSRHLLKRSETCGVYRTIGEYNIVAELLFGNIDELQQFIDEFSERKEVKRFNHLIATTSYKPCPWFGV